MNYRGAMLGQKIDRPLVFKNTKGTWTVFHTCGMVEAHHIWQQAIYLALKHPASRGHYHRNHPEELYG